MRVSSSDIHFHRLPISKVGGEYALQGSSASQKTRFCSRPFPPSGRVWFMKESTPRREIWTISATLQWAWTERYSGREYQATFLVWEGLPTVF